MGMNSGTHRVWRSEDKLLESVLSCHVDSRIELKLVDLAASTFTH